MLTRSVPMWETLLDLPPYAALAAAVFAEAALDAARGDRSALEYLREWAEVRWPALDPYFDHLRFCAAALKLAAAAPDGAAQPARLSTG